jgi:phosphatidylserine/phosphatidylglycerophosphate/cardiolipin synthase-like enzyme
MVRTLIVILLLLCPAPESARVEFAPTGDKRELEARVEESLGGASKEIRVAMFQFTSTRLADALARRAKAGVRVRVLLDAAQIRVMKERRGKLEVLDRLAGVEVRYVTPRDPNPDDEEKPRFHHKFCVLDEGVVITGSYNWTVSADRYSCEDLLVLPDAGIAKEYARRFDRIWKDKDITRP